MQRRPGRDHRVDGVFLLDLEIDQHGSFVRLGRLDRGHNIGAMLDDKRANAISLRELGEIRPGRWRGTRAIESGELL